MASHSYIMEREKRLIDAKNALVDLQNAFDLDVGTNDGHIPDHNLEVYNAAYWNAVGLNTQLNKLLKSMEQHTGSTRYVI